MGNRNWSRCSITVSKLSRGRSPLEYQLTTKHNFEVHKIFSAVIFEEQSGYTKRNHKSFRRLGPKGGGLTIKLSVVEFSCLDHCFCIVPNKLHCDLMLTASIRVIAMTSPQLMPAYLNKRVGMPDGWRGIVSTTQIR